MKTKHLLTALALPVVFAACTADDIETVGVNSVERVALNENFKLNFGGVESRLTAGKPGEALSITFEANDEVGGAIVDTYDGAEYTVVDYVSTNHPFVYDGATWNIEHTMVEGNYLFYYPYNENNHSRSAAAYSIPVLQDLSDKVTGEFNPKAAIEKYAMSVGHQFLNKEDLSASVELAPIFSYARLVLKLDNTYAGGEVDKVVLQSTSDFKLNGQISNTKVSEIFGKIAKAEDDDAVAAIWEENKKTENFALETSEEVPNAYYNENLNKTSKVMVGKVPAGVSLKVDAQNNKTFETYMVMPAQSIDNLTVFLYMKDGRVFKSDDASFANGLTFNRNTPKKVEASMVKSDNVPYIVTSEKDWNEYVSLMGKTPATFIIAGEDFAITNTVKYPSDKEAIITVGSALKITGDNVTMKNVKLEEVVTVEKNAVLNTDATATYIKRIDNKGTLNVVKVVDKDGDAEEYNIPVVWNYAGATLNVEEDAVVSMYLSNQINNNNKEMAHGVVVNNGTITFSENSTNAGEIINNGSLTGSLTNNGEYTCTKDKEVKFTPIITNNAEIFASGAWINAGKIINAEDAEITVSKFGTAAFNNKGVIDLANGSHCLITDNAGGELVLATLNQSGWTVESANGTIAYSTLASDAGKAYDFETTGKGITKIYVNGNLGITKKGALKEVVVEKNATLNMPKGETIANLTICEDVDVIVNAYDKDNAANVKALVVEEGATLTINKDNAFVCSTVENEGTVYVGGSFTATETTEDEADDLGGKYKTTSVDGSIWFEGMTDAQKDAAAKAVPFKNFIQTYVDNGSAIADDQNTWAAITAEAINEKSDWATSSTEWVKEAVEKFVTEYNEAFGLKENSTESEEDDPITKTDFETVLAKTENAEYFTAALNSVKATAEGKVAATIKAQINDNDWVGDNVYEAIKTGYKINEIVDGETMMIADFVDAVKEIEKTDADGEVPGSVWLALQDVTTERYFKNNANTGNVNEIPEYSYIENYETSYLYKVLKLMKEFTYTAPETNTEKWQTTLAAAVENKKATNEGIVSFYNEVYKIYKDADAKLTDDLVLGPQVKAIADEAATVVKFEYTDEQIVKAVVDGEFGTELNGNGAEFE